MSRSSASRGLDGPDFTGGAGEIRPASAAAPASASTQAPAADFTSPAPNLIVRHMTEADIPEAAEVGAAAFDLEIDTDLGQQRWHTRIRHPLLTDPEGAFVAVTPTSGAIAGVALAIVRDRVWILSHLTVDPNVQSGGVGRALMHAALGYCGDLRDGIIVASNDPRALRLYASSGFDVVPTFKAEGRVDARKIPPLNPKIVPVAQHEVERLAPISRAVRGAEHTPDFALAYDRDATVFRLADRGFVVAQPGRGLWGPIALDAEAATDLLWCGLEHLKHDEQVEVSFVTGEQQWALGVFIRAGLSFEAYGGLAVRGNPGPLYPYIPSPPFA